MNRGKYSLAIFTFWAMAVVSLVAMAAPEKQVAESQPIVNVEKDLKVVEQVELVNSGVLDAKKAGLVAEESPTQVARRPIKPPRQK